jgi:hypothetical protein
MQGGDDLPGDLFCRFSFGRHGQLGFAIQREPSLIQAAERGGVVGQRARILRGTFACATAAFEKFLNLKLEENHVRAMRDQQFSILGVDEGPAAECDYSWGGGVVKDFPQHISLDLAEALLALHGKDFVDTQARAGFDLAIKIEKAPMDERT